MVGAGVGAEQASEAVLLVGDGGGEWVSREAGFDGVAHVCIQNHGSQARARRSCRYPRSASAVLMPAMARA